MIVCAQFAVMVRFHVRIPGQNLNTTCFEPFQGQKELTSTQPQRKRILEMEMSGRKKGKGHPKTSRTDSDCAEDIDLIRRIASGDKHAFEQLYYQYHRKLYQFLVRIIHNPGAAEELLNDVMYVVWSKASTFKYQSRVSTWIFGIAYRKALKEHDKSKRRPEWSESAQLPESADEGWNASPEKWLNGVEFADSIKRGISKLSTEHRSVVELTALGHSYGEISEILHCPLNTVKTRMFYARRQLKQTLRGAH